MKLTALIIAYLPNVKELVFNVKTLIGDVDQIIIFQNSLIDSDIKDLSDKIILLGTGKNIGIASALNEGVKWSIEHDYTHILTLDQDSYFEKDGLKKYKELIESTDSSNIGIYGINPRNWGKLLYNSTSTSTYLNVNDTITSGSIFPLSVFKSYGLFEDDLFIDAVDYEFCYRLNKQGMCTIIFPSIFLEHKVGNATKTWLGFRTDNYSAFRTYYVVRNQIIIWKRYPSLFSKEYKITLIKGHIISRIIKIILAEKDKVKKIKSILIGIKHGLSLKTGFYKI